MTRLKTEGLQLTKAQRNRVFDCRVGYGVVVYKSADDEITSFEFYLDRENKPRYIRNGAPVEFEVKRDVQGDEIRAVPIYTETYWKQKYFELVSKTSKERAAILSAASDVYDFEFEDDSSQYVRRLRRVLKAVGAHFVRGK